MLSISLHYNALRTNCVLHSLSLGLHLPLHSSQKIFCKKAIHKKQESKPIRQDTNALSLFFIVPKTAFHFCIRFAFSQIIQRAYRLNGAVNNKTQHGHKAPLAATGGLRSKSSHFPPHLDLQIPAMCRLKLLFAQVKEVERAVRLLSSIFAAAFLFPCR